MDADLGSTQGAFLWAQPLRPADLNVLLLPPGQVAEAGEASMSVWRKRCSQTVDLLKPPPTSSQTATDT